MKGMPAYEASRAFDLTKNMHNLDKSSYYSCEGARASQAQVAVLCFNFSIRGSEKCFLVVVRFFVVGVYAIK